jgi:hemerythrin superfamily protein
LSARPDEQEKQLPKAVGQFSPEQVNLRRLLELAKAHDGDRFRLIEAIRAEFFATKAERRLDPDERLEQQQTLAYNATLGMRSYGLVDRKSRLTDLGRELLAITDDSELARAFARHILRDLNGFEVLEAIRAIQERLETPTKEKIVAELRTRGFKLPRATTYHLTLIAWLRQAGVVGTRYEINDDAVEAIAGTSLSRRDEWASLTRQQKALLRTLRRLADFSGTEPLQAKIVLDHAETEHGRIFPDAQLRRDVYRPLEEGGWVTLKLASEGRGGKSGTIAPTSKLLTLDLETLPVEEDWGIPTDLRPKLNTPLATIEVDLNSKDTHTKGVALELLALRLARDATLVPLRFRLRADKTGGGEVDLIAEGIHLHFSRWLFQCKNTSVVRLHDLAKEIGMAVLLRAHVVVLVTTGRFAQSVVTYANEIADTQNLQVVLIDKDAITRYRRGGPAALMDFLHGRAEATMRLKRGQVARVEPSDEG